MRSLGASDEFHFRPTAGVKLGGRAFDVPMVPIETCGAVVSKDALIARVWPGRIIEENSLAAQIAALRAAFGAERALIRTVSGRGYQFTGDIRVVPANPGEPATQPASVVPPTNIPEPVSAPIGREMRRRGDALELLD